MKDQIIRSKIRNLLNFFEERFTEKSRIKRFPVLYDLHTSLKSYICKK